MSLLIILAVSGGVSGKIDLSLYSIIPLIYISCTLPIACQEIKSGPYFMCLGLAELLKLIPDCIQAKVFFQRPQDTYWSMSKSPLQATIFLHFWCSGSAASLHLSMFSHLSLHFKNLWYKPSFTVQSMWGLLYRACTWFEDRELELVGRLC